jgi:cytochrome c
MMKACLTGAIALLASSDLCRAQDVAAGEVQFKKCAPCHDVGEKAKNRVGPMLNGLDGRKAGMIPNFKYSEANKNSGIVWDEAQFLDYIKDPKAKIPRTFMVFSGIKDEADAKNLWLAGGLDLSGAIAATVERWMHWRTDRTMQAQDGIPAGLPYLVGLVGDAEIALEERA